MKLGEFELQRILPTAAAATLAGSASFASALFPHGVSAAGDYYVAAAVAAFFSFLFILAIVAAVELGAMFVRPRRSWLSLTVCLAIAVAISFPFWPPEIVGAERWAGEHGDPRHWAVIVYAVVAAIVWWGLLPTPGQRQK